MAPDCSLCLRLWKRACWLPSWGTSFGLTLDMSGVLLSWISLSFNSESGAILTTNYSYYISYTCSFDEADSILWISLLLCRGFTNDFICLLSPIFWGPITVPPPICVPLCKLLGCPLIVFCCLWVDCLACSFRPGSFCLSTRSSYVSTLCWSTFCWSLEEIPLLGCLAASGGDAIPTLGKIVPLLVLEKLWVCWGSLSESRYEPVSYLLAVYEALILSCIVDARCWMAVIWELALSLIF